MAENSGIGLHIGDLYVAAPACADDIILLGNNSYSLQCLLNLAKAYAARYIIHPQKSVIAMYDVEDEWKRVLKATKIFSLSEEMMPVVNDYLHLGLSRYTSAKAANSQATDRVKLGRRTNYALMGVGFHGINGFPVLVSIRLYQTYVLPRLTSGLEAVVLNNSSLETLEKFHRSTLRMIQNLPIRVAKEAIYLLTGMLPIEAYIDQRRLSLFGAIARRKPSKLWDVAMRQLIMKDPSCNSWFASFKPMMLKYQLPHPIDVLDDPVGKIKWKRLCKSTVTNYLWKRLTADATLKSSLINVKWREPKPKYLAHPLWCLARNDLRLSKLACLKVKILTHTYSLQARVARNSASTCPLCNCEPETEIHFIAKCKDPEASSAITVFITKPEVVLEMCVINPDRCKIDPNFMTQLVLDQQMMEFNLPTNKENNLEVMCLNLLSKLHKNRASKLGYRC